MAVTDTAVRLSDDGQTVEVYLGKVDEDARTARHDVFAFADAHLAIAFADDLAKAASDLLAEQEAHAAVLAQGAE